MYGFQLAACDSASPYITTLRASSSFGRIGAPSHDEERWIRELVNDLCPEMRAWISDDWKILTSRLTPSEALAVIGLAFERACFPTSWFHRARVGPNRSPVVTVTVTVSSPLWTTPSGRPDPPQPGACPLTNRRTWDGDFNTWNYDGVAANRAHRRRQRRLVCDGAQLPD